MKVLFCDENGCATYVKKTHTGKVYKFLYWENEGDPVIVAGSEHFKFHGDLANAVKSETFIPAEKPVGAGKTYGLGVTDWKSIDFRIETPEYLRLKIAETLGLKEYGSVINMGTTEPKYPLSDPND